ncbi:MAG: exo-alpha-sialidase [Clostridia bacterium]|nr:exo-alpha-sialidase [Clostridia bacterium]
MKSIDLAKILLDKAEGSPISEVFDFFGYNCIKSVGIDYAKLDELIRCFENGESRDENTLGEIIDIVKNARENVDVDIVKDIKRFINENLSEDLSVEEIAKRLNVSYYYLCHVFKKKTDKTISEYRNEKRMEKAVKLLISSVDKISIIAQECGFNNLGYFTEIFSKIVGCAPTEFREKNKNKVFLPFYDLNDCLLTSKMDAMSFLSGDLQDVSPKIERVSVSIPDDKFAFLHESAIIEFKGVLYASWYNCVKKELIGYTPIIEKRSYDGGRTWINSEIIAEDKSGKILFCPPVYGIGDGKLYMFLNQMVAPDHIHSLDLYVLDENTDQFIKLWSRPIPFKLNTNVIKLSNGKLILPGRVGELDGFPITPAVLISDNGKLDVEWRLVKVAQNGDLADGEKLVHPETTVIECADKLYMFNRNDRRKVPIVYESENFGESWSEAYAHDIPYVNSKIYAGTLKDGRNYLVANVDKFDRSRLVVYFSEKNSIKMTEKAVLFDMDTERGNATACHYPCAVESNGKLYVIATLNYANKFGTERGSELFIVNIE